MLTFGCAFPRLYWTTPIQFRVVDDATGAPLPDVAVAANWDLRKSAMVDSVVVGNAFVFETVSRPGGEVFLPALGPKLLGPWSTVDHPVIIVFKEG
jgi:hypothetical protein